MELLRSIDIHLQNESHNQDFHTPFSQAQTKQNCSVGSEQLKAQLFSHFKIHQRLQNTHIIHRQKSALCQCSELRVIHNGSAEHYGRESFLMQN